MTAPISRWAIRGAFVVNATLALLLTAVWITIAQRGIKWFPDFIYFYTAGLMVKDGNGARLYDFALQAQYQALIPEIQPLRDFPLPFINPPFVAILFAPLAAFSASTAFWIWTVVQLGLLGWAIRLLLSLSEKWGGSERALLVSGFLAFYPLAETFHHGAYSLLILDFMLVALLRLHQSREEQAGMWLTLGAVKPQLIFLPALFLLSARRWGALLGMVIAGLALAALPMILFGWQIWWDYLTLLPTLGQGFELYGAKPIFLMHNLKGTLTLVLGPERASLINILTLAGLLGAVAMAFVLAWGTWEKRRPQLLVRFAMTIVLGLLFSPYLNQQDTLVLIVPAVAVYSHLRQEGRQTRPYAAFVLACPLFFALSELIVGGTLGIRGPVVAMLVLAGWIGTIVLSTNTGVLNPSPSRG